MLFAINTLNIIAAYHVGDDGHDLSVSLPYLMGFLVVLITLAILMALCMGVGAILKRLMPKTQPTKSMNKPARHPESNDNAISPEILTVLSAAVASMNDQIPDEIYTVIAAATATMLDKPHRIIHIKPHTNSWSDAGRLQILTSHNLR